MSREWTITGRRIKQARQASQLKGADTVTVGVMSVRPDADLDAAVLGGARPEHAGGVVHHTHLPGGRDGDEPDVAAGRSADDARRGLAQRQAPVLHQRRDVARHRVPDDGLALARGGHRAQRVGVRAGAHHGGVADAADHLVDQPTRGGRRGEVARGVNGHAPHRADLAVVVRRGLGLFHWLGLGVIDLRGSKRRRVDQL
jgi:hypothetical protein